MIKLTSLLKENNFDKAPDAIYSDRSVKAFNQGKSKRKDYSASNSTAGLKYLSKLVGRPARDVKNWIDKIGKLDESKSEAALVEYEKGFDPSCSRLGCQIQLTKEHDGLVVHLLDNYKM